VEYPTTTTTYAYYLHLDHIGLPRAMTNQAGQLVWNTFPRPYGDIAEKTTTDPLSGRVVVTNLRLPGQYDERLLGSLGLQGPYYNWNRWYLPGVGRYLELDPLALEDPPLIGQAPDWYNYAGGNPLTVIDPEGLAGRRFPPPPPWHPPAGEKPGCTAADDCPTLKSKMATLQQMIDSHTYWDRVVPRPNGGNRHAGEIADLWRAWAKCQGLYDRKCNSGGDCKPCKYVPVAIAVGVIVLMCQPELAPLAPLLVP